MRECLARLHESVSKIPPMTSIPLTDSKSETTDRDNQPSSSSTVTSDLFTEKYIIKSGLSEKEEEEYLRNVGLQVTSYFVCSNGNLDPSSSLWLLDRQMFLSSLIHSYDFMEETRRSRTRTIMEILFDNAVLQLSASLHVLLRTFFFPIPQQIQRIGIACASASLDHISALFQKESVIQRDDQLVNGFYSIALSSPQIGSFLSSLFDLWGVTLDYFQGETLSVTLMESLSLLLSHILQSLSLFLLSSDAYDLLFCGDGQRVVSSLSLKMRFLSYLHVTMRLAFLEEARSIFIVRAVSADAFEAIQLLGMRLLVTLSEKNDPYFLDLVAEEPLFSIMQDLIRIAASFYLCSLSRKTTNSVVLYECLRVLELCCDDSTFKKVVIRWGAPVIVAALNLTEKGFHVHLESNRNLLVLLFRIIGNLHCFNPAISQKYEKDAFLHEVLAFLHPVSDNHQMNLILAVMGSMLNYVKRNYRTIHFVTPEDIVLFEGFYMEIHRILRKNKFQFTKYSKPRDFPDVTPENESAEKAEEKGSHFNLNTVPLLLKLSVEYRVAIMSDFGAMQRKRVRLEEYHLHDVGPL